MAQPIMPENWVDGLNSESGLVTVGRYTAGLFTGRGVKFGNAIGQDGVTEACRVWDMIITDYITDYDDRRINGLGGVENNKEGRDGWGASAYGVFQDVRFISRVYTMGRNRSCAWRIFDEMQYSGDIGEWGDATNSNVITSGQNLMKTAAIISKAKEEWVNQVLGPDIDKYNLSAIFQGHISGRWVADNPDVIFDGQGHWVAQPGPVQGVALPPRFAPIHAVEWDDRNIPLLLNNIEVTWTNLRIPMENRVCILDPFYRIKLMQALMGQGIPPTEAAFAMMQAGEFTELMGWKFNFAIPTQYWPELYLDANYNVVHSPDGQAPYDQIINSIPGRDGMLKLQDQLAESDRMVRPNYIRTVWDEATGTFKKVVTNYPLGQPGAVPYLGVGKAADYDWFSAQNGPEGNQDYPWSYPGSGYGLPNPTGPVTPITRRQVIGAFVYQPAAQLSQEYDYMYTDTDPIRGKFTEMVTNVKYDAWVIEGLSHGIIPIIDSKENIGDFALPVKVISTENAADEEADPTVTTITANPSALSLAVGQTGQYYVSIEGTGPFDNGYEATTSNADVVSVGDNGVVNALSTGTATISVTSLQDPSKTTSVTVTVQ